MFVCLFLRKNLVYFRIASNLLGVENDLELVTLISCVLELQLSTSIPGIIHIVLEQALHQLSYISGLIFLCSKRKLFLSVTFFF